MEAESRLGLRFRPGSNEWPPITPRLASELTPLEPRGLRGRGARTPRAPASAADSTTSIIAGAGQLPRAQLLNVAERVCAHEGSGTVVAALAAEAGQLGLVACLAGDVRL
jgi:hypothetical protein